MTHSGIDNPKGFVGYDENTWGLTASDDPFGYLAHEPGNNDNGTITPTAALSSLPYTPEESMAAFKNFYHNYGEDLWGIYGFKDSFHPTRNWTASSFLAIDQGPIIIMVENYRTILSAYICTLPIRSGRIMHAEKDMQYLVI